MRVKRHQCHPLGTDFLKLSATLLGILKHPRPNWIKWPSKTHHRTKLESKCKYVKHINPTLVEQNWHSHRDHLSCPKPFLESWNTQNQSRSKQPSEDITKRKSTQKQVKLHQSRSLPVTSNSWMPSRAATYCTEDDSAHEPRSPCATIYCTNWSLTRLSRDVGTKLVRTPGLSSNCITKFEVKNYVRINWVSRWARGARNCTTLWQLRQWPWSQVLG